jgi:TolB protein
MKRITLLFTVLVLSLSIASGLHARAWDPAWSPDGTQIVYTCDYGGSANIWIADANGGNPLQLTNHPHTDWDPDWSKANKIVFGHDRNGDQSVFNLWTVDADGTNLDQLTFSESGWETEAVWSPDGTQIAYDGIVMMDANGTNPQFIVSGIQPSFNGAGTRIVFADGDEIWTADLDGDNVIQLTSDGANDWHPDFSKDGTKIVFTSQRDGSDAIWTMDADGSNLIRVADSSYTGEPQWSPDGTKIIYEGRDDNIWVVNADGTGDPVRIPTATTYQTHASVMNAHEADGSFRTNLEVELSGYPGNLPDELIDLTITLKRPDGSQSVLKSYALAPTDFTYFPQWNSFFVALEGSPEIGLYEFTVETVFDTRTDRDAQQRLYTIPNPDISSFSPASGGTVTSTTPLFSWAAVAMDDPDAPPLFYRLEIGDMSGERVWASGRNEGMTACAVPQNKLTPGETYQWRVRVSDSSSWIEEQNRSLSEWIAFTMAGTLNHSSVPAIDLENYGVSTWSHYGGTGLDVWITIFDQDGVAYDGSSHHVTLTGPDDNTVDMYFSYAYGDKARFSYWSDDYPQGGTYTITVTDPEGNVASVQEELVVTPVSPTAESSISPSNMDEFMTATFDNVEVNENPYDDFSAYADIWSLDPNKWNSPGGCAAIVGQAVQMSVTGTVGRGNCGLSVADPASVDSLQADVTINSVSSTNAPRARIRGLYYFNGYGDVSATVNVKGNRIYYSVSEEYLFNGVYSWKTLAEDTLMTVTTGQTVTISIDWDGATLTMSANDAANTDEVFSGSYTAPGLVAPPILGREALLQIRTNLVTPDTTPTFAWDPVSGAARYRVRIYDASLQRTLWRGYTDDTQYTIPPGVMAPDAYYQFRIDAYGDHTPLNQDNCAGTNRYRFYTASEESPVPRIEFDSTGVQTYSGDGIDPYLSFWVKVHDAQGVPGNIRSVKVQFPDDGPVVDLLHFASRDPSPTSGFYANDVFIDPVGMDGTYTFFVEDWDGNVYQTTEDLAVNLIGYPDPTNFSTTVTGTAVDVDWDDVTGAAFYRLEIYDKDFNRLHAFATTESQYSIPEGVLKANTYYRYRIKTFAEFFDQNVDNASSSPWSRYDRPTFVTAPVSGSNPPSAALSDCGVAVWHMPKEGGIGSTYMLGFEVKVTDADGVPENIQSVTVTFPGSTTTSELSFDGMASPTEAIYWSNLFYDFSDDIPAGTYTFTITDFNGVSVQTTDELVKNVLPIPENCQPASGSIIIDTTPTISWDGVPGASAYKVRIYEGFDTLVHESDVQAGTEVTVPTGLLEAGKTYNYRVYAYRENLPAEETDNVSVNALFPSERPFFTVAPDTDTDGDGVADVFDNCPGISNAGQVDTDLDGLGNRCDDDADGDGLANDIDADDDGDGLPDAWENDHGLDPLDDTGVNGAGGDLDNDGWSNADELLYGTLPDNHLDVPPPVVLETIPHDNAGIASDDTRVAVDCAFSILVEDPGGIDVTDATSVVLTINDGINAPYVRDLSDPEVGITSLTGDPDTDMTRFWVAYNRVADDLGAYPFEATISIIAALKDSIGTADRVVDTFTFKAETQAQHDDAAAASPEVEPVDDSDPFVNDSFYTDAVGIEVSDEEDPLNGAAIAYESSEAVTPTLGPSDELPAFTPVEANAVGAPLNLQPPAVFSTPVKIRIPCPDYADVSGLNVYLFNGTDWVFAYDATSVQPDGEDWAVDGSRVNINNGGPSAIELKVYHFSGAQAAAGAGPADPPGIDDIDFDAFISECPTCPDAHIDVTAHDPAGGSLSYAWTALNGGAVLGSGATVDFDPPNTGPHPCPYEVQVQVTSSVSGLTTTQIVPVTVKLTGDVDGSGVVNILDKVAVRNAFGSSGAPGWVPADVDCSGVVNILDKVIVRNQFGQSGCKRP